MSTEESIKLVILAFTVGLAAPLVVQLFLTLRTAQRAMASTRVRIERTLDGLDAVIGRFQGGSSPTTQALSAFGAALVPAAAAAFKAWRESAAAPEAPEAAQVENKSTRENGDART